METPRTRIELCGRLLVEIDGEGLQGALPGRQGRLLFAYLVMNRDRPVRRDELIEALWSGNGQPASGDALLRPPLSRLRKALGPGRLEGRNELAALGMQLRRSGLPEEAHDHLTRALELAEVCGAGSVAAVARAELVESGVEPSVEAPSGLRALTDTQRRVAMLAAEGQSEREIAQAMFVTPNAVDFQLGDVYRKLGISSRDELALALAGD